MTFESRAMDDLNIVLDSSSPLSLQHQLRQKVINAIHRGVLRPGRRLPSSRSLAKRIHVARNTVSLAYDALLAEGHLVSRARSGIFVAPDMPGGRIGGSQRSVEQTLPLAMRLPAVVDDNRFRCPNNWHQYPFPFIDGRVDAELSPIDEWREAMRLACSRHEAQNWNLGAGNIDDLSLLEEIRSKVLPARGIDAGPDELLITMSARHALQLVGELLIRRSTPVVLEEPVDAEFERRIKDRQADLSILDLTLAQPLPQGAVVVTSARRTFPADSPLPSRLLAAVVAADGVLVEHDMPPGTRDGSHAAPALRALDTDGRVVYVGSLASVVSCGEPLGMISAVPVFIERLRELRNGQGTVPPQVLQRAWAYFIGLGHYSASLLRAGRVLGGRRIALRDALNHYLHKLVTIETLPGASAYWVSVPEGMDAREFARRAAAIGVLIEPTRLEGGREAICMGVTGLAEANIRSGVQGLKRLVRGDLAPARHHIDDETIPALRGRALRQTLAGSTLLYNTVYGDPCRLDVRANGELIGTAGYANEDCDRGRWWLEGDRWFRQWQQWAYAEVSSYAIVIDGDQLRWYGSDGLLADTAVITRQPVRRGRIAR
jgi:GntR family transcriptional regulator/MocR family aminotransferase